MVALSWLAGAASPSPSPGSERPEKRVRPRQGLLDPDPEGEASRSPRRGAGAPRLAGRLRVRAAGRRRADSGALRERRGSHSDEIPVPGQRHQPASAFLLPSQIETEGGGREVEKKKKNQPEREGEEAPSVLRPDPLVATSALPRGPAPGAPAARDPALRLRAGRAPRLCRGKQGLIKLERNFSQLLMNRRLGSRPSPPPGPPPSPPRPPSPPTFFSSRPLLRPSGLRSEPARGGGAGPSQSSRTASLSAQPSWAPGGRRGGGRGFERARWRVLQRSFYLSLFFFFLWWDFFFKGEGWQPPSN
eukprot:XP_028340603.1 uncharacterized protein LOC114484971 [Physeter catodon]